MMTCILCDTYFKQDFCRWYATEVADGGGRHMFTGNSFPLTDVIPGLPTKE
jgi:hypothetical protein